MVVFVVLLQDAQRKIPVQYSSKIRGNKQMGGQQTCIPLKVNTSGVIPVIFAQSLMQTPVIIASFLGKGNGNGIGSKILKGLSQSNWCDPKEPVYSIGLIVYIVLIIACLLYTSTQSLFMMEESMFLYMLQRIWLDINLVSSLQQELTEDMEKTRRNQA